MKQSFGDRLRNLRATKQMTLQQISQRIGVPLSTYKEWESGRQIRGEPYLRIADVYEISLHELFTGEKPEGIQILESIDRLEAEIRHLKKALVSFL